MTTALEIVHATRGRVFGVRFKPGEAFAFVSVSAVDVRDQVITRATSTTERADWARAAAEHGFADQAHLAREVRRLTGVHPSVLAGEVSRHQTRPVAV